MTESNVVERSSVEIVPVDDGVDVECSTTDAASSESSLSSTRRSVRFSEASSTLEIDTEASRCVWYSRTEIAVMVETAKQEADFLDEKFQKSLRRRSSLQRAMEKAMVLGRGCGTTREDNSHDNEVDAGDERRGLETIRWNPAYRKRRGVMKEVVKAVIAEQERQKNADGALDPEKIAHVAVFNGSSDTVLTAQKVGAQDELVASLLHSSSGTPDCPPADSRSRSKKSRRNSRKRRVSPRPKAVRNR